MMKVLFLDVDGVLNSHMGLIKRGGQSLMDVYEEHVNILEWTLERCKDDVKIVVSSTWRLPYIEENDVEGIALELFSDNTFLFNSVIGMTPRFNGKKRGAEIHHWALENSLSSNDFVILDDDSDMVPCMDRLVQVDNTYGLTHVSAVEVLEKFYGKEYTKKVIWGLS